MFERIREMWANLRGPWVTDAPTNDLGSLDELAGMHPVGEIPPMTEAEADRLWADVTGVPFADWDEHMDNTMSDLEGEWDK